MLIGNWLRLYKWEALSILQTWELSILFLVVFNLGINSSKEVSVFGFIVIVLSLA